MRERDLKALEFDKVVGLVAHLAVSEPGRRAIVAARPATDPYTVRERLRATAELVDLRAHSGSIPIDEFDDQRPHLMGAAPEDAVLNGPSLVRIRDFVVAARTAEAFLRSRVEIGRTLRQSCGIWWRRGNWPTRCCDRWAMTAGWSMRRVRS